MKREEAIKKLQKQKERYLEEWLDYSGVSEAYDMAIEALQAETKHGKWIKHDDGTVLCECSECHEKYLLYEEHILGRNYCPNCGAKMDKE